MPLIVNIARQRMRRLWVPYLLVSVSCLGGISTSFAQNKNDDSLNFAIGNFEFVLLHELAHLVIGEKDVPILGPIESAADYMAATILARGVAENDQATQEMHAFGRSAATAFATSWKLGTRTGASIPYWDMHSLGIQRYYSVLCLLYGSDPEGQRDIPKAYGLPEQRAVGCAFEYEMANRALQWMLDTYGRKPEDMAGPTATFEYGEPRSRQQLRVLNEIRRLNIFELTVNAFTDRFAVSEPFVASMRSCGRPQAAWQPKTRELVFCYELLDAFLLISKE